MKQENHPPVPSSCHEELRFCDLVDRFEMAKNDFEESLYEMNCIFDRLTWDVYDYSLHLHEVPNDFRLTETVQVFVYNHNFRSIVLFHRDGWETSYSWESSTFSPHRGWRRRWVSNPTAQTDRQVGGGDPGWYEISYLPDEWIYGKEWLDSGYIRIVPDPLDTSNPT